MSDYARAAVTSGVLSIEPFEYDDGDAGQKTESEFKLEELTPTFLVNRAQDLIASPTRAQDDETLFPSCSRGEECASTALGERG